MSYHGGGSGGGMTGLGETGDDGLCGLFLNLGESQTSSEL